MGNTRKKKEKRARSKSDAIAHHKKKMCGYNVLFGNYLTN